MFYKVIIVFHNAFFFQLQLIPDSTNSWFPTLDTSCSSRALCTAFARHQLQFGALNACCRCSRPWHHNPKTISRIQIYPRIQTRLRIWRLGSFWAVFWILESACLRATRLPLLFLFRISERSARPRERQIAKPRDARNKGFRLSRAWSY